MLFSCHITEYSASYILSHLATESVTTIEVTLRIHTYVDCHKIYVVSTIGSIWIYND